MRKIVSVVLHCSDSDIPRHDNIATIDDWHRARGWSKVGYHWFVRRDGTVERGRDEAEVGAHAKNHNKGSIGVCLSGKTFSSAHTPQFTAAVKLVEEILSRHKLTWANVMLHRDLDRGKTCPNFTLDFFKSALT